jgi:uncharacterized protein YcfL
MISFLLLVVACSSLKSAFTNASSSLSMSDRLTRLLFLSHCSQPTTDSPSNEPQSRGISETGVEVQTSVESEQTCLKLPPNKEHNVILDSNIFHVNNYGLQFLSR